MIACINIVTSFVLDKYDREIHRLRKVYKIK